MNVSTSVARRRTGKFYSVVALDLLDLFIMTAQVHRPATFSMFLVEMAVAAAALVGAACHSNPIIIRTSTAAVGGTIAGVVHGPTSVPLQDRTVTAINIETGQRYETTTGPNGGYTLRVPEGTYRIDVQVRPGEKLDQEAAMLVKNGDSEGTLDVTVGRQ